MVNACRPSRLVPGRRVVDLPPIATSAPSISCPVCHPDKFIEMMYNYNVETRARIVRFLGLKEGVIHNVPQV